MDPTTEAAADKLVAAVISDPAMADFFDPMVIATLIGIALANIALVTSGKHALMILEEGGVKLMDNPWFKAALEFGQPVLGGSMACIPGLLPFEGALNVVLGICAGFLSPLIYRQVLAKWFPEAVVSGDSKKREKHRALEDGSSRAASAASSEET